MTSIMLLFTPYLDIERPDECQAIGGTWNACPKSECQENAPCPKACGAPRCEGAIPKEEGNLSSVHNLRIKHQSSGEDKNASSSASLAKDANGETTNKPPNTNKTVDDNIVAFLLALMLLLIVFYLVWKSKNYGKPNKTISN